MVTLYWVSGSLWQIKPIKTGCAWKIDMFVFGLIRFFIVIFIVGLSPPKDFAQKCGRGTASKLDFFVIFSLKNISHCWHQVNTNLTRPYSYGVLLCWLDFVLMDRQSARKRPRVVLEFLLHSKWYFNEGIAV